jgi:hypothetical protein
MAAVEEQFPVGRKGDAAISSNLSHPNDSQSRPDRLRMWLVQFPVCPSSARNPVFERNIKARSGDKALVEKC